MYRRIDVRNDGCKKEWIFGDFSDVVACGGLERFGGKAWSGREPIAQSR